MSYYLNKRNEKKMDTVKIILIAIGLIAVVLVGYWLIGVVAALLWLLVWIGVIGAIGYGGYRLFFAKEKETPRLEEKPPVVIAEMKDVDRALEEYKRKSLPK
jgi:hypothetical protein